MRRAATSKLGRRRHRCALTNPESLEARHLLAAEIVQPLPMGPPDGPVFELLENSPPVLLDVFANDDPSQQLTLLDLGNAGGIVQFASNRRLVAYQPRLGFAGDEKFGINGNRMVTVHVLESVQDDVATVRPDGDWHDLDLLANDRWLTWDGVGGITSIESSDERAEVQMIENGRRVRFRFRTDRGPVVPVEFEYRVDGIHHGHVRVTPEMALMDDAAQLFESDAPSILRPLDNDPFWAGYAGPRRITSVHPAHQDPEARISISDDGQTLRYASPHPLQDVLSEQLEYVVDGLFAAKIDVKLLRRTQQDSAAAKVNSNPISIDLTGNDVYYQTDGTQLLGGRVTSVSESTHGATLQLQPDGKSVLYMPPLDFYGQDKFEYTTEYGFREQVTVDVSHQFAVSSTSVTARRDGKPQLIDVLAGTYGERPSNGSFRITEVSKPKQGGKATIVDNQILYEPPAGKSRSNSLSYIVDGVVRSLVIHGKLDSETDAAFKFCNPASASYSLDVFSKLQEAPPESRIISAAIIDQRPEDGSVTISADGHHLELAPQHLRDLVVRIVLEDETVYRLSVLWPYMDVGLFDVKLGSVVPLDIQSKLRQPRPCSGLDENVDRYDGPLHLTDLQIDGDAEIALRLQDDTILFDGQVPATSQFVTFHYVVDDRFLGMGQLKIESLAAYDSFAAAPGAERKLPVLRNDALNYNYEGATKITAVSASKYGATLRIVDDGQAVVYLAPTDLPPDATTDTFTYTVDGLHMATVAVRFERTPAPPMDLTFAEWGEAILADVPSNPKYRFSTYVDTPLPFCSCLEVGGGVPFLSLGNSPVTFPSRTMNRSVADVQGLLYAAIGEDLVVLENLESGRLREVQRLKIGGVPISIYQTGSRLTIVSGIRATQAAWARDETNAESQFNETRVTVIDTSAAGQPRIVQSTQIEGRLRDSQLVDGQVRLVLEQVKTPPGPKIQTDHRVSRDYFEFVETYASRAEADWGTFLTDSLPNYVSFDGNGIPVRTGLLHTPQDLNRSVDTTAKTIYSFVALDPASNEPGIVAAAGGYGEYKSMIHLGERHAYLLYETDEGTRIQRVQWQSNGFAPQIDAAGVLPEKVVSADYLMEYGDTLAVVAGHAAMYTRGGEVLVSWEGDVLTLQANAGGWLEVVGRASVETRSNWSASDKGIRLQGSVLQVPGSTGIEFFELADAKNPRKIAFMSHLPGATHLEWINERYLLAKSGSSVMLWDAIDRNAPVLLTSATTLRPSFATLAYDRESGLATLTHVATYDVPRALDPLTNELSSSGTTSVVEVFRVTLPSVAGEEAALQRLGDYPVSGKIKQTLAGEKMVTFTDRAVVTSRFPNDDVELLETPGLLQPPARWSPPTVSELLAQTQVTQGIQAVKAAMAPDAPSASAIANTVPVAVEWRRGGFELVLDQNGQLQHWREQNGQATKIASDFVFATPTPYEAAFTWHNGEQPLDVNGDGFISPIDALLIINRLNQQEATGLAKGVSQRQIASPRHDGDPLWDSSGDGYVSPIDAILVINELEAQSRRKKQSDA